jgi:tripartite-type tricarboxylate transporter receptor subunit TctC
MKTERMIMTLVSLLIGVPVAYAQTYPVKPVRIVTSEPGGGTDFAARVIAQGLTPLLGQQVVVENRPNGVPTIETVTRAAPDGHTLLLLGSSVWLLQYLQDNVSWDPLRDLAHITLAMRAANVVAVHPSLPVKSVQELIVLAKQRPGELNYGTAGAAASNLLAAELFKAMAGVNLVRIPYKGTGPAMNALLAGEVQLMFPTPASVMPHAKSGRLRALAVTSAEPSDLLPGLPTVASAIPGYESVTPFGVFATGRTPAAVVSRLNQEIVRVIRTDDVRKRFADAGVEVVGSTPEQLTSTIKAEMSRMGKVIKAAGIRSE